MTFSNEPGIYIYNEFGIRVEDCFVVTDEGARYLGDMLTTSIDYSFQLAPPFWLILYSVGVIPVISLKALLKADFELNPASNAIAVMVNF